MKLQINKIYHAFLTFYLKKKNSPHEILFRNSFKSLFHTQFLKDYYKFVKHHLSENYLPKNVTRFPAVDELKEFAEKKFFEFYNLEPTCAVYAPGTLSIAGKCMGVAESKSLSMVGCKFKHFCADSLRVPIFLARTIAEHALFSRDRGKRNRGVMHTSAHAHTHVHVHICLRLSSLEIKQAIQLVTLIVGKYYQYKRCRIVSFLDKTKVEKVEIGLKENELYIADKEKLWIRYLKGALRTFKEKYCRY